MEGSLCLITAPERAYTNGERVILPTAMPRAWEPDTPVFLLDGYNGCLRAGNDYATDFIHTRDEELVCLTDPLTDQTLRLRVDAIRGRMVGQDPSTCTYIAKGDLERRTLN